MSEYREKKERKEPRPYSQSSYSNFNKEWICLNESGMVISHSKDLCLASEQAAKKVGSTGFMMHYIDLEVIKK